MNDWTKFKWSNYNAKGKKFHIKHIMANPHECDECGDLYNKVDLISSLPKHLICRNCIDEYYLYNND